MTAIYTNAKRLLGLTILLCGATLAFAGDGFPGKAPDNSLIKTQQKADKLYHKGDFDRAMFIYRDELAPIGDKFAQYMVGFMHYRGQGREADAVVASAWYRLAAERGEEKFVRVRDALLGLLNAEQRARSDAIYAELRSEMGDLVLISRLVNDDISILRQRYGNNLGPILQAERDRLYFGRNVSEYQIVVNRLAERVDYLVEMTEADSAASEQERERVRTLEKAARREIGVFEASIK